MPHDITLKKSAILDNFKDVKITNINLVPDTINPSPDYYYTKQSQFYATSGRN